VESKRRRERNGRWRERWRRRRRIPSAYTTSPLPFVPSNWKEIDVIDQYSFPNKFVR
jgi:hypothetical protein